MGITLSSAARLVEAVPGFIEWLWPLAVSPKKNARGPRPATGAHGRGRAARGLPSSKQLAGYAAPQAPHAAAAPMASSHRPLRVLRVWDGQQAGTGRMLISGRMADVCAELDRLAEAEASQLAATRQ